MKITSVKIKKINSANPTILGKADIQLDGCLMIHGLTLLQLNDKRIVGFPSKKMDYIRLNVEKDGYNKNCGYLDIVHPCTKELREYIETTLFKIYDEDVVNKEE